MNRLTASYLFECDIHDFETPNNYYFGDDEKEEVLDIKNFEIRLGDNLTKWEFQDEITESGVYINLKKKSSNSNNFSVRATCLIPGEAKDGQNNSMYCTNITGTAKSFEGDYQHLYLGFDDIKKGLKCRGKSVLKILIKMELIEGNFPRELSRYVDDDDLCSNFEDLYYSEDFSDFTIACSGGEEFPVHRCILAANSSVLRTMMLSEMKESIENKLEVNDIDGTVMDKILFFMYTQKISGIAEHLEGLLYGAEKYQIKNLKALCIGHMFDNLSVEKAVEYFMLASLYNVERLKQLCLLYIQTYHEDLRKTEEWDELTTEQLDLIEQNIEEYKARDVDAHKLPEYFWCRDYY